MLLLVPSCSNKVCYQACLARSDTSAAHFGFLGAIAALDTTWSSAETRERFGWRPIHPGLIADPEAGFYFDRRTA
jgi:hypothetical protein